MDNNSTFVMNLNREQGKIVAEVLLTIPGFVPYGGEGETLEAFAADAAQLDKFIAAANAHQEEVPSEVLAFLAFLKCWMDKTTKCELDDVRHKKYYANADEAPSARIIYEELESAKR